MSAASADINSGGKPTTINISLGNLVEKFEIHTTGAVGETTNDIKDKVVSALLQLLNSANAVNFARA
jgi:hypothetical protein